MCSGCDFEVVGFSVFFCQTNHDSRGYENYCLKIRNHVCRYISEKNRDGGKMYCMAQGNTTHMLTLSVSMSVSISVSISASISVSVCMSVAVSVFGSGCEYEATSWLRI